MENGGFVIYLIALLIGVLLWFFLMRASVRANRQIELLESIDNKLSKLVNPDHDLTPSKDQSAEGYLAQARKNAGLND